MEVYNLFYCCIYNHFECSFFMCPAYFYIRIKCQDVYIRGEHIVNLHRTVRTWVKSEEEGQVGVGTQGM